MKNIFSLCIIFLFILPAFSQKLSEKSPAPFSKDVRTGTLQNGMRYYIRKNEKPEKRAELRLVVNVGSNMEDDDQQGLAHFVEHMAFNGTKNFKKNELIDYLESVGTKFGPHLNAYTSFDETVYMMQIPTDQPDILDKGFQILEDWADNLSFDSLEVEKERGVVIEEWRSRKGANDRMQAKYLPVLFKDSRYAERLPIGKKEILETFDHRALQRFYQEWYRPELMAVIVVGDVDPEKIEKKIKEQFSGIVAQKTVRERKSWPVPEHDKTLVSVATDKEATYTSIQIVYKHPLEKTAQSIGDMKYSIMTQMYGELLNARLSEEGRKADAPFAYAWAYYSKMVRTKSSYTLYSIAKDGKIREALELLLRENKRVIDHGFTQSELDRVKKSLLVRFENDVKEKGKTESSWLIHPIVEHYLNNEPLIGEEQMLQIFNMLKDKISLEEINALNKKWTHDHENTVVVITAPEKEGMAIPSEKEVLNWYHEYKNVKTVAYQDNFLDIPLLEKIPEPGTIAKEEKSDKTGIITWKLSNGAIIKFKKTDFQNDEILFSARSRGGLSLVKDEEYSSGRFAAYIVAQSGLGSFNQDQLEKYLADKNVSIYPLINSTHEGFGGSCSPGDLETMMQMLYLYFAFPRKDHSALDAFIGQQRAFIENRSLSPFTPLSDSINCVTYNYHKRILPVTADILSEISLEQAFRIYLERFSSTSDFTFYFVGNIQEEKLKEYVTRYIGSSHPAKHSDIIKDNGMRAAPGKIEREIKKGTEPKSNVHLRLWKEHPFSPENKFELDALMKLLSIKLRENLREDKSGVYGVGAYSTYSRYPLEHYTLIISFGCAPENVELLIAAVHEEIEKIKASGCEEKDLVKIKETFKRERETDLKKNRFWLNSMVLSDENGDSMESAMDFNEKVDALSSEKMKEAAKLYLDFTNYSKFVLNPEK